MYLAPVRMGYPAPARCACPPCVERARCARLGTMGQGPRVETHAEKMLARERTEWMAHARCVGCGAKWGHLHDPDDCARPGYETRPETKEIETMSTTEIEEYETDRKALVPPPQNGTALARREPDRDDAPPEDPVPRETDDTRRVYQALARAQIRFPDIHKSRPADLGTKGKIKYASLVDVTRETLPILREEGIVTSWRVAGSRMFFRLTHAESGQWIESDLAIVAPDNRGGSQALGAALSYLRRYLYIMMLGIVPLDDPDDETLLGRMTGELVNFILDCAAGRPDAATKKPLGRPDLVASMKRNREPAAVQNAALQLFDERWDEERRGPQPAQQGAAGGAA